MPESKEELLKRALNTTNFSQSIHEDLSDLVTVVTPKDTPMVSRLSRTVATALTHEWTETVNTSTLNDAAYADGGTPAANTNTHSRKSNKVMAIGRRAQATELLERTNTVGKRSAGLTAFEREVEEKMQDLMRSIEWYIFNGDSVNTSPQEMDGLLKLLTTLNGSNVVANGGGALIQTKLDEALSLAYDGGGAPDMIVASPIVCQRIANFTADKVRYVPGGGPGGLGKQSFQYLSPFGYDLEVIPVRSSFLPTGNVLVLDSSKISLAFLSNGIEMKELAVSNDSVADRLIKAYLTLELRCPSHHARLTGVANALS